MPTNYRIQMMAVHPNSLALGAPDSNKILGHLESLMAHELNLTPLSASVERADDANTFTEHEGKGWLHNAPDDMILAFAKMLDGFVAQLVDPESPVEVPADMLDGPWDEPGAVKTAEAFLAYRKQVKD